MLVFVRRPLAEEDVARIFAAKVGAQGLFEGAAKEHGCTGVLFLPAIEVAMAITPRAGQVLTDLGIAVGHQATCGSCPRLAWRKFFPLAGRRKAVKPEQGSAVERRGG